MTLNSSADNSSADSYVLREATVADAALISEYRALMFSEMGQLPPEDVPAFVEATMCHVEQELPLGRLHGWIFEHDGQPVAGGILVLQHTAPTPGFIDGRPFASIQNIWTDLEHRRRGLAGQLVSTMIAWCRERGIRRLGLNATEAGRGVYTALGFRPSTTYMTLVLD